MLEQSQPTVSRLTDDTFALAWTSNGQDGNSHAIVASVFNATTMKNITSEFIVNTYYTDSQQQPILTSLTSDKFVVAWASNGQDGSSFAVVARVFNATTGNNLTSEFIMNNYTTLDQFEPALCRLTNDTFVASWSSNGQDGSNHAIIASIFNATTGKNITAEFIVNNYTTNSQSQSSLTSLTEEIFVVVWSSVGQDGSSNAIVGTVINATTGKNVTSEFVINTYTTSDQSLPSISRLTDETFVATWTINGQDGSSYAIVASVVNATSGTNLTTEFIVNGFNISSQWDSWVCSLTDDTYVIVWRSEGQDGDSAGIFFNKYYFANAPVISVITPAINQTYTDSAPTFEIKISELNLDSSWYTLDNGITNYTFSGTFGTIDPTAWSNAAIGIVNITFYANDTYGNIGQAGISIIKENPPEDPIIPDDEPPEVAIPFGNFFILITILSIASILISEKHKRKRIL